MIMKQETSPHLILHLIVKVMKGLDGEYISKPDKNNIYKWVKVEIIPKPKHIYKIHYNGSYVFSIYDYGDKVDIYK